MVNVVDTFTRLYGRKPTETELASMLKMKADQEALINKRVKPKENLIEKSIACQNRAKKAAANRPLKKGISVNLRGWSVNALLNLNLNIDQVADILCLKVHEVEFTIAKYKLPRKDVIKPKG